MSKKGNGGGFQNRAAKRFKAIDKVATMSQEEIFDILFKDIEMILDQVTAHRDHRGQFPTYISNAFANLSTAVWFKEFVDDHVKVKKKEYLKTSLTKDQVESLKSILADAYRKSCSSFYACNPLEYEERNQQLTEAFIKLDPHGYRLTRKLEGLTPQLRRNLTIQVYGDPVYNFRQVHKIINKSTASDKKKLKYLKAAYGKRFTAAVGAAMTTEGNNSDCLALLFDYMSDKKKKKRAKFIQAYAEAYKFNQPSRYFRMDAAFYEKNKKLIKLLIGKKKHPERAVDAGYRKAFACMLLPAGRGDKKADRKSGRPF